MIVTGIYIIWTDGRVEPVESVDAGIRSITPFEEFPIVSSWGRPGLNVSCPIPTDVEYDRSCPECESLFGPKRINRRALQLTGQIFHGPVVVDMREKHGN